MHEIKKSTEIGIIRGNNTIIKREKLQSPREVYDHTTPEQYKKMSNTLDVRIQGGQKRPNECV